MRFYRILLLLLFYPINTAQLFAQNTELSQGIAFDGEPYLLVNPQNNQHLIVAWMGFEFGEAVTIQYRTSFDGGNTWSASGFLPHTAAGYTSADPCLAFDADGTVFLSYIDYAPDGSAGAVQIVQSEDGGLSWTAPVEVIHTDDDPGEYPVDRPWMAVDYSGGAYQGNIYVNTKPAPWEPIPNRSYFIRSTDHGLSFSNWTYIDTDGFSIGDFIAAPMAFPAVNSVGDLFIIYPGWELSENILPRFILATSIDGGNSFSYNEVFEDDNTVEDTLPKRGYSLYTNPYNPSHLFFLFLADYAGDLDIYGTESFNKGSSWTAPFRINQDTPGNGNMQDLAWASFNAQGDLLVTWRDRRYTGLEGYENTTEIWGCLRPHDADFGEEFQLSSMPAPHQEVLNGNGNDFMCNALVDDTVYAVWGDARDGTLRIWFAQKVVDNSSVQITQLSESPLLICSPNPAVDNMLTIQYPGTTMARIINQSGQIMEQFDLHGTTYLDLTRYPTGIYYLETITGLKTKFIRQ
jgi:hypothetical protein